MPELYVGILFHVYIFCHVNFLLSANKTCFYFSPASQNIQHECRNRGTNVTDCQRMDSQHHEIISNHERTHKKNKKIFFALLKE